MDFKYSEEDEAFRQELRSWLEKNAPKRERSIKGFFSGESMDPAEAKAWHRKLYEGGWIAISWPKEYGGRGASLLQQVIYQEELKRVNAPAAGVGLIGPTLMHWGTEEQKKRFLPGIMSGETSWCQGFSEPNHGSDLAALETKAVESGDYFVVNGAKIWTSGAHHADWIFMLTRSDPEAPKHKGISFLLADMRTPGITVRPLVQITGEQGFNQVFFDDVKVPRENLVGPKNAGWQVAITTLGYERSTSTGFDVEGPLKDLVALAKKVKLNGVTAWDNAGVRQKIGEFATEVEAIKYTSYRQLTRELRGLPPGPEGSMLKMVLTELNARMCHFAMELLGPYGQLEIDSDRALEHGMWSFRELAARATTIFGGTNQIQRNILGERVLGLPKG